MTQHFQPGQHPDADQLSAFVEHALPPHEQQAMLAHLSVCSDCRAIAYLAQPPEPAILPQPAHTRTPLFARWMLAFPAAAVLTCLVILTVHTHNLDVARDKAAAANTAHLEQTPPPPPAPVEPPPTAKPQPESALKQPAPKTSALDEKSRPEAPQLQRDNNSTAQMIIPRAAKPTITTASNSPFEKKDFTPAVAGMTSFSKSNAATGGPAFPAAAPALPPASPNEFHGAVPLHSAAAQYSSSNLPQQAAPSPAPPPPQSASANSGIYGGTGQAALNQNYVEGAAASNASAAAAPAATNQTVTVNSAAPMLDTIATASDETIAVEPSAKAALKKAPRPTLPSHLPAVSVANSARHQLALDTAGTLFRSEDAGVTWQPVTAQWTGRATKVALIPASAMRQLNGSLGAISAPRATAKAAAPPPTFQLTTDTGATWTSTDGQTWTQQK